MVQSQIENHNINQVTPSSDTKKKGSRKKNKLSKKEKDKLKDINHEDQVFKYVKVAVIVDKNKNNGEKEYVLIDSDEDSKKEIKKTSNKITISKGKKNLKLSKDKEDDKADSEVEEDSDEDSDDTEDESSDDDNEKLDSDTTSEDEDDDDVEDEKNKKSLKTAKQMSSPKKSSFANVFAKRGDKRVDQRSWSLKFSFVVGGPNSVKDFCYVRLENTKEVCFFMRAPYFQTIISAYAELYLEDNDKFKETLLHTMSLTRRAEPYGENNALLSDGGGSKYNVYGLFFIIPKKTTKAFMKYLKKILRSKEFKTTIKEWKKSLDWSNKTTDIICNFESDMWKSIIENTKEDFENYCDEVGSLDAFLLDKDIEDVLRNMYAYKGDNFKKDVNIMKTGWKNWKDKTAKDKKKLKKVKIEKD